MDWIVCGQRQGSAFLIYNQGVTCLHFLLCSSSHRLTFFPRSTHARSWPSSGCLRAGAGGPLLLCLQGGGDDLLERMKATVATVVKTACSLPAVSDSIHLVAAGQPLHLLTTPSSCHLCCGPDWCQAHWSVQRGALAAHTEVEAVLVRVHLQIAHLSVLPKQPLYIKVWSLFPACKYWHCIAYIQSWHILSPVYGGHWHTDLTFYLGNLVPCLACASPKLPTCPHFPMHQPFRGNAPLSNPADQFYSWPFPHGLFFLSIHWQWHSDTLKTFHCTQLPFPDPTASGSHHLDLSYHLTTESFKVLNTYSANCRQKQKFAKPIIVSWKLAASLKRLLWRKATTLHSGFCIFVHWMNIGLRFGWKIYYFGNSL